MEESREIRESPKKRKPPKTEAQQARQFGVVMFFVLTAIAGYLFWKDRDSTGARVLGSIGAVIIVLTLVLKPLWMAFFRLWMKFAHALGWVMTRVLLSIFYFGVITPVGVVMRLMGKTPLDLKFRDARPSYWIEKKPNEYTIDRYSKLY